ncbi:MAG TPA: hypothetical protein VII16_08430 [Actinomycetes bacterium]
MAAVNPDDDTIRRCVVRHYRYDRTGTSVATSSWVRSTTRPSGTLAWSPRRRRSARHLEITKKSGALHANR